MTFGASLQNAKMHLTEAIIDLKNGNTKGAMTEMNLTDQAIKAHEQESRGAEFITEPKDHDIEIRCYIRDPDGYLIEVGQTTGGLKDIKIDLRNN